MSDAPKTEAGFRKVFVPESFSWIFLELRRLRPDSEYLATNKKGERMTTNCLRDRFRRVCKWTGVRYRSCHKLRKTYGTIVQDAGFDENLITSIMGHTDIRTSETFYHFDRKTDEMKQERINSIGEFQRAQ